MYKNQRTKTDPLVEEVVQEPKEEPKPDPLVEEIQEPKEPNRSIVEKKKEPKPVH